MRIYLGDLEVKDHGITERASDRSDATAFQAERENIGEIPSDAFELELIGSADTPIPQAFADVVRRATVVRVLACSLSALDWISKNVSQSAILEICFSALPVWRIAPEIPCGSLTFKDCDEFSSVVIEKNGIIISVDSSLPILVAGQGLDSLDSVSLLNVTIFSRTQLQFLDHVSVEGLDCRECFLTHQGLLALISLRNPVLCLSRCDLLSVGETVPANYTITNLSLSRCSISPPSLYGILPSFKSIRRLTLPPCVIGPELLDALLKCPLLSFLSFSEGTTIGNLDSLGALKKFEELEVWGKSEDLIRALKDHTDLSHVAVLECKHVSAGNMYDDTPNG